MSLDSTLAITLISVAVILEAFPKLVMDRAMIKPQEKWKTPPERTRKATKSIEINKEVTISQ
jgi:hypothetical protein